MVILENGALAGCMGMPGLASLLVVLTALYAGVAWFFRIDLSYAFLCVAYLAFFLLGPGMVLARAFSSEESVSAHLSKAILLGTALVYVSLALSCLPGLRVAVYMPIAVFTYGLAVPRIRAGLAFLEPVGSLQLAIPLVSLCVASLFFTSYTPGEGHFYVDEHFFAQMKSILMMRDSLTHHGYEFIEGIRKTYGYNYLGHAVGAHFSLLTQTPVAAFALTGAYLTLMPLLLLMFMELAARFVRSRWIMAYLFAALIFGADFFLNIDFGTLEYLSTMMGAAVTFAILSILSSERQGTCESLCYAALGVVLITMARLPHAPPTVLLVLYWVMTRIGMNQKGLLLFIGISVLFAGFYYGYVMYGNNFFADIAFEGMRSYGLFSLFLEKAYCMGTAGIILRSVVEGGLSSGVLAKSAVGFVFFLVFLLVNLHLVLPFARMLRIPRAELARDNGLDVPVAYICCVLAFICLYKGSSMHHVAVIAVKVLFVCLAWYAERSLAEFGAGQAFRQAFESLRVMTPVVPGEYRFPAAVALLAVPALVFVPTLLVQQHPSWKTLADLKQAVASSRLYPLVRSKPAFASLDRFDPLLYDALSRMRDICPAGGYVVAPEFRRLPSWSFSGLTERIPTIESPYHNQLPQEEAAPRVALMERIEGSGDIAPSLLDGRHQFLVSRELLARQPSLLDSLCQAYANDGWVVLASCPR
jgi:hypothetical protein